MAEFNITYLNHHFNRYYHLASNMTPWRQKPRSAQSYFKILWDVFVLFSYHERAGDKFVMPYWKVRSGLLSTLSHPDPTRWSQVGCGWLWMDIRPDHTFQQGVTNMIPHDHQGRPRFDNQTVWFGCSLSTMCITSCELPFHDSTSMPYVLFMTRTPHNKYEMIRIIKEMTVEVVEY